MIPEEIPQWLPPQREVDHQIELIPRAKLPAMTPYRMAPPELERRKQLKEFLDLGHIKPSKAPFSAACFVPKKEGRDDALMYQLPSAQQSHGEEKIPHSFDC